MHLHTTVTEQQHARSKCTHTVPRIHYLHRTVSPDGMRIHHFSADSKHTSTSLSTRVRGRLANTLKEAKDRQQHFPHM